MRPGAIEVVNVGLHEALQMTLPEDQHMVQTLSADTAQAALTQPEFSILTLPVIFWEHAGHPLSFGAHVNGPENGVPDYLGEILVQGESSDSTGERLQAIMATLRFPILRTRT
jgi:hypothetical protein